jgi:hypothetical protein
MIHRQPTRFSGLTVCVLLTVMCSGVTHAQTFSLDGPTAGLNGVFPDDLLFPGPAPLLPGAAGLPPPPPPGIPLPPVDVDAFTFSQVFPAAHTVLGVDFSVAPGSIGAAGTAVIGESGGVGFADEPADIFSSGLAGGNGLTWDGDGIPTPGVPSFGPLGVIEPGSNTDGWDATPPFGPVGFPGIYYTITAFDAAAHPVYTGTGATGSYIFFSPPVVGYSVLPALYATDAAIGLGPGDDIDALALIEDGSGGPSPADVIYFSLTPGSPTLAGLGASPADILVTSIGGAPAVAFTAGSIGLLASDDVDALDLFVVPEPASAALMCLATPLLFRRRG